MRKVIIASIVAVASCNSPENNVPAPEVIEAINLKKGEVIWCGPAMANFGSVKFNVTASPEVKKDFDQAIAMLHSFEYEESEKAFAAVIAEDPSFTLAYWGVAMSNFHPLWEPPKPDDLKKGSKAIEIARAIKNKSPREADYLEAIAAFYDNWQTVDHKTRCLNYERKMEAVYKKYPNDSEAAVFYALALNATAEPTDKTHANQMKAGEILNKLANGQPDHPGIIHYIIHNYDSPELAENALTAARKYASVAPASAHAQHMPSHIFVRLGLWDEAIASNIASVNSARCYAEKATLNGNFDEELHGLDYLMYAYLQKGDNKKAEELLKYLRTIKQVSATNAKVAYAYAAMPSRYVLENRKWKEAAVLQSYPENFTWKNFPWQNAITVFTRLLGKAHTGDIKGAEQELDELKKLQAELLSQKDKYKANQVQVQILAGSAWIDLKKGDKSKATEQMRQAADLEDATMKHPVTPGEVLPARELLGDMYLALNQRDEAIEAYASDLKNHAKRLNGLKGASLAEHLKSH
ncbi:MAG: hypothetical protein JNK79_17850 [Chitinophagaceae bacterium]|nr:hypothetical protein [Chitinophagaceae bacterium]